jgi:hypothetical protein
MPAFMRADDLTEEQRLRFGIELPAKQANKHEFTARECRQWALRVMGVLSKLNQRERERVLMQALRVNEV